MSEPTPRETPPRPKRRGGLPLWAWGAIAAAAVVGVVIWRKNSAGAPAAQSDAGAPETVTPVPVGTGLTSSQYGALASQNAAIYEAILDLQGEKSEPREDHDADDKRKGKPEREDHDRDDRSEGTDMPTSTRRGPREPEPPRGTTRLPGGKIVPEAGGTGLAPARKKRPTRRPPARRR